MSLLLDHLWQSTLVAALAALLTITLRHNAARVRFWLWFAASMKFLTPFAALAALGRTLSNLHVPAVLLPQLSPMRPDASSGVAVWAHVGGFVAGVLLVRAFSNPGLVRRRTTLGDARAVWGE